MASLKLPLNLESWAANIGHVYFDSVGCVHCQEATVLLLLYEC
jgi:hypothetical protein